MVATIEVRGDMITRVDEQRPLIVERGSTEGSEGEGGRSKETEEGR